MRKLNCCFVVMVVVLVSVFCFCFQHAEAKFVSENIRDDSIVFYGEHVTKKWTFKNTSGTTWSTDYVWKFVEGTNDNKSIATITSFSLCYEVSINEEYTFEIPMVVPFFDVEEKDIYEKWVLVDNYGNVIEEAWVKVKAVNCPISNDFEYPVGYPISNVDKQAYEVTWDFVDQYYDVFGWHQSEDWNGKANGSGNGDLGDPVHAVGYGYVVADPTSGYGNKILLIRHVRISSKGEHEPIYSRYYHLDERLVGKGSVVYRGQQIATIGDNDGSMYAHLDFGIIKDTLFTVEHWKRYCELKNLSTNITAPPSYTTAALAWVCNKDPDDPEKYLRDEERKEWLLDTHYNPFDHRVNTKDDGEGHDKVSAEYDEGDIFFVGNNNIIVDERDGQFASTGENWEEHTDDYRHYFRFPQDADGHSATWRPNIPSTQDYDVFVGYWSPQDSSKNAKYKVKYANDEDEVDITQNIHSSTKSVWYQVYLGTYTFSAGQEGYVKIENSPGAIVDQVYFKPVNIYIPHIDTALIIDSSGSMIWNDLLNLRKEAAKIFVDTAQNDDQVAIVDFDNYSYSRWHLQPLTEDRSGIKFNIDLIDSQGGTNISEGLLQGHHELSSSTQPHKKVAVLLTDGVGYYDNEACLYQSEGWPIYTVGLGYSTNPALLEEIAEKTGGQYFALTDPNQLKNVYFEIATQISGGNSLMSESSVMSTGDTYIASVAVPTGQQSATFLTTWPGSDVNTTLTSPGGSEITPANSDPNIYYAKGLTYELYRITNPDAGTWEISIYGADLASGGETVNISVSSVGPPVPQDTTPPIITTSNPIDGKIYFDQMPTSFNFAIEDPETAVTSQTALLNGNPINNNDNILLTQLGENVLTITATNEANLTSELSIIFYVNHFSWLPPIKYQKGSATETLTSVIKANSTLPLKFAIFDANSSFVEDTTVKVVVEGTTAQFTHGEGDTNIRINQEEGEEPLYIVNIHTNFNKCDYGLEEGNEYWLAVYFDDILAAKAKMKIE